MIPTGSAEVLAGAVLTMAVACAGLLVLGNWHYGRRKAPDAPPYWMAFFLLARMRGRSWPSDRELPWLGLFLMLGWATLGALFAAGRMVRSGAPHEWGSLLLFGGVAGCLLIRKPLVWALLVVGLGGFVAMSLGALTREVLIWRRSGAPYVGPIVVWSALWLYIVRRAKEFDIRRPRDATVIAAPPS